jgi:hypothetical protein
MKCRDCEHAKRGWFKSVPEAYVCVGVKNPFVIKDFPNAECSAYKDTTATSADVLYCKLATPEPAKPFVDDYGIYVPSNVDSRYHKLLISRELFVEVYNRWIADERKHD